jgi:hypothetical protein
MHKSAKPSQSGCATSRRFRTDQFTSHQTYGHSQMAVQEHAGVLPHGCNNRRTNCEIWGKGSCTACHKQMMHTQLGLSLLRFASRIRW